MQQQPASRLGLFSGRGRISDWDASRVKSKRATVLDKVLPRKFSSRLFLMAFVAGLIPIVVFTILIDIYGKRIENESIGSSSWDIARTCTAARSCCGAWVKPPSATECMR